MATKKKETQAPVRSKIVVNPKAAESAEDVYKQFYEKASEPRSTYEIYQYLRENKHAEVDALVLCANSKGQFSTTRLKGRKPFMEAFENGGKGAKLKESVDLFGVDAENYSAGGNLVGVDSVPLLGGPFNKQLYIYDALRMFSQCFYAYNHDPVARAIVHITRDFTLGRGFRVDSDNQAAQALWAAFAEANKLDEMIDTLCCELSTYGEVLLWWLPQHETKIQYQVRPGQEVPKGLLPRVRLQDPSTCWEIITYPEDIQRVLAYQFVYPTQYQIYTTQDKGQSVPSMKFIVQQVPSNQMDHFKINCFSNEKRGRSDLYPILGYLKRLRDSVNYSIIALQKAAAWAIDTSIEGSQTDIDAYISAQQEIGTIAPAGSEFVHTSKIKREYLSNSAATQSGSGQGFEWCMSMISAGCGIPTNYFGTHLSGGSTRASALVATEPVAKKFQQRQLVLERVIKRMWQRLMDQFGIHADCEVTFPEVIVQDRSAKLKDLALCQQQKWISAERASEIAAKELGVTDYDYTIEQEQIAAEAAAGQEEGGPFDALLSMAPGAGDSQSDDPDPVSDNAGEGVGRADSAVTSKDRRRVSIAKG